MEISTRKKNTASRRYPFLISIVYVRSVSLVTVSFTITRSDEVLFGLFPLAARIMISNRMMPPATHTIGFEYHICSVVVAVVLVVLVLEVAESCAALTNTISKVRQVRKNLLALS